MGNSFVVKQLGNSGGGSSNIGWIDIPLNAKIKLNPAKLKQTLNKLGIDLDGEFELSYSNCILLAATVHNCEEIAYRQTPLTLNFYPDTCYHEGMYVQMMAGNLVSDGVTPEIERPEIMTFNNLLDAIIENELEFTITVSNSYSTMKLCPIIGIQETSQELATFYEISMSDFKSFITITEGE